MADVPGKFFSATKVRTGVSPSSPGSLVGEPLPPVNPPGTSLNSVGLTMPSAFTVANSPLTSNGTIGVTGAGTVGQYIRGDGSLADFPESSGGGSSVSYYLNGSVNQGTIGGVAYKELNKVPILGAGTDFTIAADGYIASFLTDAGDPNLLEIPGGNWNFETYFSASSSGGTPSFYVELYKYDGSSFTLIASSVSVPELIAFGTITTPYFSSLAVPTTTLALTDRLAVRYYVTPAGRTITLHTENNTLCQIITTFTTGLTALNGLTAQVQNLAVGTTGTDFNIASAVATHTFNLPTASATNRGLLSAADWVTFNSKQPAGNYVTLDTAQTITAQKTFTTSGSSDTMIISHGSGSGFALDVLKAGNGEAIRVTKTSGSGNAMTISGGNFEAGTIVKTGGTSSQFLKADGSVDSNTYLTTATAASTYVPYSGATSSVNLGIHTLSANNLIANGGGNSGALLLKQSNSAQAVNLDYTTITPVGTTQLIFSLSQSSGVWKSFVLHALNLTNNTTRTYTLPDASGTIALVGGTGVGTVTSVGLSSATSGVTIGSTPVTTSGTITLAIATASGSQNGLLSSTDWTTFNGKQPAGNYVTTDTTQTITGEKTFSNTALILQSQGTSQPTYLRNSSTQQSNTVGRNSFGFNNSNNIFFNKGSLTNAGILVFNNTAARAYTLPDASGTIALVGGTGVGTVTSVAALTLGTSGTDLSSTVANGTTTPVITLNVPTASAANRGALSAADWTTFNNKQNALTNPVTGTGTTNYLPKFTGTSTIGNSNLINDASGNLGLGVTPSAWVSNRTAISIKNGAELTGFANGFELMANAYNDGSWKYIATSNASGYQSVNGAHFWYSAPSGTAGNAISFTQAMTLFSTGNLLVGTPSPISDNGARLQVSGTGVGMSTFGGSGSGIVNSLIVENTSNTANSHAVLTTKVAGASGGNPHSRYEITGVTTWFAGVNNAASDAYVIAGDAGIGAGTYLSIATTGAATFSGNLGVNGSPANSFPLEAYINSSTSYTTSSRGNVFRVYNSNTGANIFAGIELGGAGIANDGLAGINGVVTGSGSGALTFYTRDSNTFSEKVRITSSGNVVINNSGTSASLASQFVNKQRSDTTTPYLNGISNMANSNSKILSIYFDGNNNKHVIAASYYTGSDGGAFSPLTFQTTDIDRLTITTSGNVGIGTTDTQSFRFAVDGPNVIQGDANTTIRIFDTTSATTGTGGGISFAGYFDGTTSFANTLSYIKGGKENSSAGNFAAYLAFGTRVNNGAPTERMRITSSGNVGIGTTSDNGNRLRVNGIGYFDEGLKTGSIGTHGAGGTWKLGNATIATVTPNRYLRVEINGVEYQVPAREA